MKLTYERSITMSSISTKIDLYRAISKKTGFDQKDVKVFYEGLVDVIHENLNKSDETSVHLPYVGKMNVKVIPSHLGFNPKNQEPLLVPTARRAYLRFYPKFTGKLNEHNTL